MTRMVREIRHWMIHRAEITSHPNDAKDDSILTAEKKKDIRCSWNIINNKDTDQKSLKTLRI